MATTFIIVFDVILKISFELFQHQAKLLVDSYSSGLFNYYIKIIVLNTSFLIIKKLAIYFKFLPVGQYFCCSIEQV